MNRKKLFLWSLYDFANSFVYINFILYFAQWLVIDGGVSDFWYNAVYAITTIILLGTAPILAAYTDRYGGRKPFLNYATIGTFLGYGFAALLAFVAPQKILLIYISFLLGQYFYQLSFVFYNPLLEEIAEVNHRARASGIGQFANALGQVVGILVALPFAASSRIIPLFPATILFFLLSLPMMIFFKEDRKRTEKVAISHIKAETKQFVRKLLAFFAISAAAPVLVSFFFFNDALLTITSNYSIYMERVFAASDSIKSILLMGILAMSAVGGLVTGWLADKIGALKTLKLILVGWIILLPLIGIAPNMKVLSVLTLIVGTLIGSVWAVTRAYLAKILTKENMAYGLSFYTLSERFASFIGPLTWGIIIAILGNQAFGYRVNFVAMTVFVIIGLGILHFWRRMPADVQIIET